MSELGKPKEFSGQDTRQGEIILRTPMRKAIFIAGLAGCILIVLLAVAAGCVPTP